jgi:hypothetical protein
MSEWRRSEGMSPKRKPKPSPRKVNDAKKSICRESGGKIKWRNRKRALGSANHTWAHGITGPQDIYKCEFCHEWHTTHIKDGKNAKTNKQIKHERRYNGHKMDMDSDLIDAGLSRGACLDLCIAGTDDVCD